MNRCASGRVLARATPQEDEGHPPRGQHLASVAPPGAVAAAGGGGAASPLKEEVGEGRPTSTEHTPARTSAARGPDSAGAASLCGGRGAQRAGPACDGGAARARAAALAVPARVQRRGGGRRGRRGRRLSAARREALARRRLGGRWSLPLSAGAGGGLGRWRRRDGRRGARREVRCRQSTCAPPPPASAGSGCPAARAGLSGARVAPCGWERLCLTSASADCGVCGALWFPRARRSSSPSPELRPPRAGAEPGRASGGAPGRAAPAPPAGRASSTSPSPSAALLGVGGWDDDDAREVRRVSGLPGQQRSTAVCGRAIAPRRPSADALNTCAKEEEGAGAGLGGWSDEEGGGGGAAAGACTERLGERGVERAQRWPFRPNASPGRPPCARERCLEWILESGAA